MKWAWLCVCFGWGVVAAGAETTTKGIVLHVEPPVITRKMFDPQNPPKEMPKLTPPEVGTCVYSFGCSTEAVMRGARGRRAYLSGIQVVSRLKITLWTPQNGPSKILTHEEGHRAICEIYYQPAESIARRLAERAMRTPLSVSVRDRHAAEGELKKIQNDLIAEFLRETATRCDFAQARFDLITQHSISGIDEAEALAQAIAEEETQYARLDRTGRATMAIRPATLIRRPPTRPRAN